MAIFKNELKEGEEKFKDIFGAMQKKLFADFITNFKFGYREIKEKKRQARRSYEGFERDYKGYIRINLKYDPLNAPDNFGLGLGRFFGMLKFHSSLFTKDLYYTIEIINILKVVEGFDINIVKKKFKRINVSNLSVQEIKNLKEILKSF